MPCSRGMLPLIALHIYKKIGNGGESTDNQALREGKHAFRARKMSLLTREGQKLRHRCLECLTTWASAVDLAALWLSLFSSCWLSAKLKTGAERGHGFPTVERFVSPHIWCHCLNWVSSQPCHKQPPGISIMVALMWYTLVLLPNSKGNCTQSGQIL